MKITVTESMFKDAFANHSHEHNFSHAALSALFEHLEELESDSGAEKELDPVALCCEFSEYESAMECIKDNGYDFEPEDGYDNEDEQALEYLNENTLVIEFSGGIIIQAF